MELHPSLFCPNIQFEIGVINILTRHLFNNPVTSLPKTSTIISTLADIYEDMRINIDFPNIDKKYVVDGNCITGIGSTLKTNNNYIYAGHDLPVWQNDPYTEVCRIMIVGYGPGRKPSWMYEDSSFNNVSKDQLTIYSPFGMHSRVHRRETSQIPLFTKGLYDRANECPKELSIYYTDYYKLCKLDKVDISKRNVSIYNTIWEEEVDIFKPHLIIPLGKGILRALNFNLPAHPNGYFHVHHHNKLSLFPIPHPSGNNSKERKDVVKHYGIPQKMTIEDYAVQELCKALKQLCK